MQNPEDSIGGGSTPWIDHNGSETPTKIREAVRVLKHSYRPRRRRKSEEGTVGPRLTGSRFQRAGEHPEIRG